MNVITTALVIWSIYLGDQTEADEYIWGSRLQSGMSHKTSIEYFPDVFGDACIYEMSCGNSTSSSSNCLQCCDRDVCNQGGCDEEGYPPQSGPVCYSCQNPLPEGRCHHVDVCQEGQMCRANGQDKFGTTVFTSGCIQKELCAFQHTGVLVGRSSPLKVPTTRSRGLHDCFHCCDADLCNKNCQPKVDGEWGSWTAWSLCTSHCDQTRTRACNNPASLHGGGDCTGPMMQTQGCYTDQCLMDGQWGAWTTWSLCTSQCNQTRTRACDNPTPLHGGKDCTGLTTQTQGCNTDQCQMDGQWGSWTVWFVCTSHCNQTRTRACDNPAPLHGGRDCPGLKTQTQVCYTDQCQMDGQWGAWTAWSLCTSHCDQTRTRVCDNPAPLHGGRDCTGLMTQLQDCYITPCQMKDCCQLLRSGAARLSGVYNITTPITQVKIQVYCDMETDGGGWTVFQKRFNGDVDFYRNFNDYQNGFGSIQAEHWLGLRYIHEITARGSFQLQVDIARVNGSKGYDVYGNFSLQPGTNYTLNIGSRLQSNGVLIDYSFSDIYDAGGLPAGNAFSTYDHDTDRAPENCAATYKGGWWYNTCYRYINLNGLFRPGQFDSTAMNYDSYYGIAASTIMFKSV